MNYKKMLLQLGMLGTIITLISTIIACGIESIEEVDEDKKAIVDAKVEFDKNSFNKKTIIIRKLPSELQSESANTPKALGFTQPTNIYGTTITYAIKSIDDAKGEMVVEVTIAKGNTTSEVFEFTLTSFQTTTQKVVDDIKIELNGKTYQTNLKSKTKTFPSEIGNVGETKTSNQIGYAATSDDHLVKFTYKIQSIDYAKGTLVVIVKISKLGAMSQEAIVTLEGFQTTTKEVNDAQQKINDEINKATLPLIIIDDSFKNEEIEKNVKTLANSDFEITSSDDSLASKIQSVTTSDDKTISITIKVSSNVEGTKFKTYLVTSFIVKLKDKTQVSKREFKNKILPKGSVIPNSVTSIGDYVFAEAILPENFKIPNSVKKIYDWAFWKTQFSPGFTLPNSIRSINQGAFYNTTLPQGFTIPDSVTNIGKDAFKNVILPKGYVWLNKNGVEINTPIVGARVGQVPT